MDPEPRNGKKSVTIRELELDDLPGVFALGERLFTPERWPTLYRVWDDHEIAELYASDGETCLVAELEERVVGFALGTLIEKRNSAWKYGYLLWLGVEPGLGRRGIGKRLHNRITDVFMEMGARIILVDTDPDNQAAVDFFRREGYGQETPHIYMAKNLTHDPAYARYRARRGAATRPKTHPGATQHLRSGTPPIKSRGGSGDR